ncbi:hypothetical protein ABS858_22840 [Vibrio neptunius]|uniref:hypothetical protein n=1 Tax=Vibrio neptunius TaxID=170651 RepID=UPI00331569BD
MALFSWMILTVAFSAVDRYFERNVQVVYDLPVLSSGLVTIGRGTPGHMSLLKTTEEK